MYMYICFLSYFPPQPLSDWVLVFSTLSKRGLIWHVLIGLLFDNSDEERETQTAEFRQPREPSCLQAKGILADFCVSAITKFLAGFFSLNQVGKLCEGARYAMRSLGIFQPR